MKSNPHKNEGEKTDLVQEIKIRDKGNRMDKCSPTQRLQSGGSDEKIDKDDAWYNIIRFRINMT